MGMLALSSAMMMTTPVHPIASKIAVRVSVNQEKSWSSIPIGVLPKYLFNNSLAFLWPRSAPDSPSRTG
jgi:hypothetical protein